MGGNFFCPPLSVQWLMSRWDLAGNLNQPLKMTHHKSDAGETPSPFGLFLPPVDMSFLGRGQKDDAKRQEASEEIEGGSQSPNAGHRSMQGIAFFGDPPPPLKTVEGPSVVLSGRFIPQSFSTSHTFFSSYFSPHCNMDDCRGPLFFLPLRTSSCKKYPSLAQGDSILRTDTALW